MSGATVPLEALFDLQLGVKCSVRSKTFEKTVVSMQTH